MNKREVPVLFTCNAEELIGIITLPEQKTVSYGVLIIVGGPQYRIGPHRQFVLLARYLAEQGISSMRFDYRGMGDAIGTMHTFETVDDDISCAIETFCHIAGLEKVILWGLCDAASAACLIAPTNTSIAGLILLNPWVRTESGAAKAYLKYYYLKRLTDPRLWKKMFSGGISIFPALKGLFRAVINTIRRSPEQTSATTDNFQAALPDRMGNALITAKQPLMILLSEQDYIAREFEETTKASPQWRKIFESPQTTLVHIDSADHTFSTQVWRNDVAQRTRDWVLSIFGNKKVPDKPLSKE